MQGRFLQIVIRTLCVLGVGMIMGDGVLTPAISVISAIEGLGNIPGGAGNIPRSQSRPDHTALSPCQCSAIPCAPVSPCRIHSVLWPGALYNSPIRLEPCACLTSLLRCKVLHFCFAHAQYICDWPHMPFGQYNTVVCSIARVEYMIHTMPYSICWFQP